MPDVIVAYFNAVHVSPYSSVIFVCTLVNYLKYRNCLYMYNLLSTDTLIIFQGITRSLYTRTNTVKQKRNLNEWRRLQKKIIGEYFAHHLERIRHWRPCGTWAENTAV